MVAGWRRPGRQQTASILIEVPGQLVAGTALSTGSRPIRKPIVRDRL
jgi:hypothetical protein